MSRVMSNTDSLKVYFVVGEESGDALGEKLLDAFHTLDQPIDAIGLAGAKMQARGMATLFDTSELSVMGVSAVLKKLPSLLKRINQTVKDIVEKNPDVLVLIDSPEFSYRVAKKVREKKPDIKIVKYVAPSVWAWRPGRAKKIKRYIDHIMAILPFEPDLLKELGGPNATYVGHPLASKIPDIKTKDKINCADVPIILVLPGSRNGELKLMLPIIRETLRLLHERGNECKFTLPAVPRLESDLRRAIADWEVKPEIICGEEAKLQAFKQADLALATSGTVLLELALYKVPMISIYKLDRVMMQLRHLITAWTTALPNLIADYPFVPERLNENANPQNLVRSLERLMKSEEERLTQLKGFDKIITKLKQETSGATVAAEKIIEITRDK